MIQKNTDYDSSGDEPKKLKSFYIILIPVVLVIAASLSVYYFKFKKHEFGSNCPTFQGYFKNPETGEIKFINGCGSSTNNKIPKGWINAEYPNTVEDQLALIKAKIKQEGSTLVIISLKGNEFTEPSFVSDDGKKKLESAKIRDRVLNTLNEQDITNVKTFDYQPGFAGRLTQSGLDKLLANPEFKAITEDIPYSF